jgi:hypothetical protein
MSAPEPSPESLVPDTTPLPRLVRLPRPQLLVDDEPFLILGLQWDCNSCYSEEEMVPLFAEAAKLGCNTAVTPVYWQQVEPEPGRFDFSTIDLRLAACREAGLRLILLWFGGYKNAECCYAPRDIREDHQRYRKVHRADGSLQTTTLCPTGDAALARDCTAFRTLMTYLRDHDAERTVIMIQSENEPGVMGADRCYCPRCTALFEEHRHQWDPYGARAAEAFCASTVARYCNTVAQAGKEIYPLPMYANAWLGGGPAARPGIEYPSGGPISRWLEIWQEHAPALDLLAPDIYTPSARQFAQVCADYRARGNPLYIAEAASGPHGRAERNAFYALGVHGAIGFDPWAIDRSFPDWFAPPFVRRHDLAWSMAAHALRDSYVALGRALRPLARAQGTDRLATFVQEDGDAGTAFTLGGVDFRVTYQHPERAGRGCVVLEEDDRHFLAIGTGYQLRPFSPAPEARSLPLQALERGYFAGDRWVATATVTQETARADAVIPVVEGSVHRFALSP